MRGFRVNERDYPACSVPMVVVCLDGCEPEYLEKASAAGLTPSLDSISAKGVSRTALCAMPSFTNPNNMSIATGRPPSVHGICGNYFYDQESGWEVMMDDAEFLRAPTIFQKASWVGGRVAVITAKDKLLALLGSRLNVGNERTIRFSAERARATTQDLNGIGSADRWLGMVQPETYSAELSEFVLAAGVKLLREWKPDVMYLTTTDYIQHKFEPGHPVANAFCAMCDEYIGMLDSRGAVVVVTADHGMKPKHGSDGGPSVVFVQDFLNQWTGHDSARVILPITDPYIAHHGSLGSFATVYLEPGDNVRKIVSNLRSVSGIKVAETRKAAAAKFDLPPDRIGDIVLIAEERMTIGISETSHDLSMLDAPLRSHGGLSEQQVPFIVNRAVEMPEEGLLRNYDAFQIAASAASREARDA